MPRSTTARVYPSAAAAHLDVGDACNTPDVTFPICTPILAVSGAKLYLFPRVRVLSVCVVVTVMLLISCHHVHFICIRVRLMHSSIFPIVRFAFRRFVLLRWPFLAFFRVWALNIFGLDQTCQAALVYYW